MPRHRPRRLPFLPRRPAPDLGPVQFWVQSPRRRRPWLGLLLATAGLMGGLALLGFTLRWGLTLMLNPQALPQLKTLLQPAPTAPATATLDELRAAADTAGERLGTPLAFRQGQADYWLLPIYAASTQQLGALRIYQPSPVAADALQLVTQIDLAPLTAAEVAALGWELQFPSASALPLTTIAAMGPSGWFTVEGRQPHDGANLRYGRLVYFDATRQHLTPLLSWSSPSGHRPRWVDLDGIPPLDLLIDGSRGLEPRVKGLQTMTSGQGTPRQLRPVSLIEIPVNRRENTYRQALSLARAGLWSEAAQQLRTLQSQLDSWPPLAEAQRQLIEHHAAQTQRQAQQTWSSPSQKILAQLIDGRWQAALATLETSPHAWGPLQRTLAQDDGRIWNRIRAFLRQDPQHAPALVWGSLTLQAQQDAQTALAWLDQRQADEAVRQQFQAILVDTSPPSRQPPTDLATESPTELTPIGAPIQAVIGTVTSLDQPPADGVWPQAPPPFAARQAWYAIEVLAQQPGSQWRSEPLTGKAAAIWQQLTPQVQTLQLLPRAETAQPLSLQLRGLQPNNQSLTLLATGPPLERPLSPAALAYSPDSLVWLSSAAGLPAANQAPLGPALRAVLPVPVSDTEIAQVLNQSTYYRLNLQHQETLVLILESAAIDTLVAAGVACDRISPKTLIVTTDGTVLYHNLFTPETLVAVTHTRAPTQLLLWSSAGYQLRPYP